MKIYNPDALSLERLAAAFPTRESRLEMMVTCKKNAFLAGEVKASSEYERQAIEEYILLQGLIMKRLFDLNKQEKAGGSDES